MSRESLNKIREYIANQITVAIVAVAYSKDEPKTEITERQIAQENLAHTEMILRLFDEHVAALSSRDAEIERLTQCLKEANDLVERFEREWYLRGDIIEQLRDAEQWHEEEKEKLAQWMISRSIATGHGDTISDLIAALESHDPVASSQQSLDDRMKAAGMLPISEMLESNALGKYSANAAVTNLATFDQWLKIKHEEFLRMQASAELDKETRGDLYEWVVAHAAVLGTVRANFRQANTLTKSVPQDVELNQILGEYLTEELAAVAPDIDWYDGRYMDGLVSGIIDVVMAGHARVPVEPTEKMILAAIAAADRRLPFINDAQKVIAIWAAMLPASKERTE